MNMNTQKRHQKIKESNEALIIVAACDLLIERINEEGENDELSVYLNDEECVISLPAVIELQKKYYDISKQYI